VQDLFGGRDRINTPATSRMRTGLQLPEGSSGSRVRRDEQAAWLQVLAGGSRAE
jgi:hypothetical protein